MQIGSGHVMRCLSLAGALRGMGGHCVFAAADASMEKQIREAGFELHILGSDWKRISEEMPVLEAVLQETGGDMVILDSYLVTDQYVQEIRRHCPVLLFDDLGRTDCRADILVNYNFYAEDMDYSPLQKAGTKLILGSKYTPLRKEFEDCPPRKAAPVRNILLSTGGADPDHVALRFLDLWEKNRVLLRQKAGGSELCLTVLAGDLHPDRERLEERVKELPETELHPQTKEMKKFLGHFDLAVSAAGSTLHELCVCGIPTITYICADNQRMNAEKCREMGIMGFAGDSRESGFGNGLLSALQEYLGMTAGQLQENSRRMQAEEDGRGAVRLAEEIWKR